MLPMTMPPAASPNRIESFISRWQGREGGQERANYALFLTELCDVLDLPHPDVAGATHDHNDYVFERVVQRHLSDGDTTGRIDLYKRNSFVLEAKQSRWKGGSKDMTGQDDLFTAGDEPADRGRRGANRAWDVLMMNAKSQAEEYARALPPSHGWPPFVLTCDVGHCIEVYADFTGQGKNYTQFPDRQNFRIYLEDLRNDVVRDRLTRIWNDPVSLDPTRTAAKVTREIAERLAAVSKTMEGKKYPAEKVAQFLMRCLFTMFAASVKLLPENSFRDLLDDCRKDDSKFVPLLTDLWKSMNDGVFAASIRTKVLKFNGNLFVDAHVLPLGREEIGELYEAAQKDWHEVEPAIFGTLLEQALDPVERRRLGAHYTPRAYVERLVVATIIEPLRDDWRNVQGGAEKKRSDGDLQGAAAAVKTFHDKLCETRVLDPACGTGNFLYVAMELMKRLEGEVLEALVDLGGQEALRGLGAHTIDPHQFLGLEINPRAAAIAELVLWIGYLQWHFRTRGGVPSEPILQKFKNIEVKNAVLTWDGYPVPRSIGPAIQYPDPSQPSWPPADFIIGNPPFIGNKRLKKRLGAEYVEALRAAYPEVPGSVDLVMYWWYRCARLLKLNKLRRFGLIATNSIIQPLNRPGLEYLLEADPRCSLVFATPDHPWVDTEKGAQVRVAMLAATKGVEIGKLVEIQTGKTRRGNAPVVNYSTTEGIINVRLTLGADTSKSVPLIANRSVSQQGVILVGEGFRVTPTERDHLISLDNSYSIAIRPYRIGNDLTDVAEQRFVIDVNDLSENDLRNQYPHLYQLLLERVKPERDKNNDKMFRENWWRYGRRRPEITDLLKDQNFYIGTCRTARYRFFLAMDRTVVPDAKIIFIGLSDYFYLGVLSSIIHVRWSLAAGAWLGVGNDSNYNHSDCFDPFPFPSPGELLKSQIRSVAEELDAFRKRRQKEHPSLTLTQMYNVLEKLKAMEAASPSPRLRGEGRGEGDAPQSRAPKGAPHPALQADLSPQAGRGERSIMPALTPDEERIKDEGLILILKELHEKLDRLVFEAYGWPETLTDEQILEKLVALNHERAAEEKRGHVRWLRPDYQIPRFGKKLDRQAAKEEDTQMLAPLDLPESAGRKVSFPADAVAQTAAVFAALAAARAPLDAAAIAANFRKTRNLEATIAGVLGSLARLGHVAPRAGGRFEIRRAA